MYVRMAQLANWGAGVQFPAPHLFQYRPTTLERSGIGAIHLDYLSSQAVSRRSHST